MLVVVTNSMPRRSACKGIVALIRRPLQQHNTSYQQLRMFRCHNQPHRPWAATTEIDSSNEAARIKSYDEIPGPRPLPVIGNTLRFMPFIGEYYGMDLEELHREMYHQFGEICSIKGLPGRKDGVLIYRPEDIETTLRNEGPWPIRDGMETIIYYRNVMKKDFYTDGAGIMIEQGKKWFEARSKANQSMMQPRVSKLYIQPISDVAEEFVLKMRTIQDHKNEMPENYLNELSKWSLETIAYVALDTKLGCLEPNLEPYSDSQMMTKAVADFLDCSFYLESGLPFWRLFNTPMWKKFAEALDTFLEVSVKHVDEAIRRSSKREDEGSDNSEPSILERLLKKSDPKSACIMAQDILFTAVHTTSYSVAMAMYQLSKNPDKQEMLFKELKRVLPSKSDPITEEKIEEMKYLKACLKESARTLPVLTVILRTTVKDIVLSNYRVPKGVCVIMPTSISKVSDEHFPLNEKYIPERWLKNRPTDDTAGCRKDFDVVSQGKRHPFTFLPFGFGARSCIGKRFANLSMEILLAKIIRNFHIEYHYKDLTFNSKILNTPKDPLRFKVSERKE